MRSMWKGAVSFGLVMIPVKLYTATEQKDIAFRQVHREDGGRIRFRRFCSLDDTEVPYEDIAKGYELPDGEMVVLTEDDMAELPLPTTKNIEVVQFCPATSSTRSCLTRATTSSPRRPAHGHTACSGTRWRSQARSRSRKSRCVSASRWRSCGSEKACWYWRRCYGPTRSASPIRFS